MTDDTASASRVSTPPGDGVSFAWVSRTQEVMVFRHEGRVMACSAICPHMGAQLQLDRRRGQVICPWHGLTFALPDCQSEHERYRRLRTYQVTEAGDHVQLG